MRGFALTVIIKVNIVKLKMAKGLDWERFIKFWQLVEGVLYEYFRGNYEASFQKCKELEKISPEPWERKIVVFFSEFLKNWKIDSIGIGERASFEEKCSKNLFNLIILSSERLSINMLNTAKRTADEISNEIHKDDTFKKFEEDLSEKFKNYLSKNETAKISFSTSLYSPFWILYWLRGIVKGYLGNIYGQPEFVREEVFRDFSEANEIYEKDKAFIRKYPRIGARMFNDRALLNFKLGYFDRAEEDFYRALSIDPNNAYVLANYAHLLSIRHRDAEALELFWRAREIFEEEYNKKGKRDIGVTGRVYHLFGLFLYRHEGNLDDLIEKIEEKKREKIRDWLKSSGGKKKGRDFFRKAFEEYSKIKDPWRAFPNLLLYLDILNPQEPIESKILWEMLEDEYDFLTENFELIARVNEYLGGEKNEKRRS